MQKRPRRRKSLTVPLRSYGELLLPSLGDRPRLCFLTAVLLLGSTALQLGNPQLMRRVIDGAMAGQDPASLVRAALAFIGLSLLQQGMGVAAVWAGENLAWRATNDLRSALARHSLDLDMSWHNAAPAGTLIQRLDADTGELAAFFSDTAVRILGSVLLLLGIIVVLFAGNQALGLAAFLFSAASVAVLFGLRNVAIGAEEERRETITELGGFIEERLAGTEDIQAAGAAGWVMKGLSTLWDRLRPEWIRAEVRGTTLVMAGVMVFGLAAVGAFIGGFLLHGRGVMSVGTVYVVVYYAYIVGRPIGEISQQWRGLQGVGASIDRIRALQGTTRRIRDGTGDGELAEGAHELSFGSISFAYRPGETVLDAVSFSLAKGTCLGILGRTGSGKSTIARLACRFYDPGSGVIRVDGVDIRGLSLAALRERVGLVSQEVQLFRASVRDNLTFFDGAVSDGKLCEAIDALGLSSWLARLPDGLSTMISGAELSAGEAQLVALTRMFLRDPGLVILDEAASRLDPATEQLAELAIDRLLAGRSAIIIAHKPAALRRAGTILVLEGGRVVEHGERSRLAADRLSQYSRLSNAGTGE